MAALAQSYVRASVRPLEASRALQGLPNYRVWAEDMGFILQQGDLLAVTERGVEVVTAESVADLSVGLQGQAPSEEQKAHVLRRQKEKDALALGVIRLSVDDRFRQPLSLCESAKAAWDLLAGRYRVVDKATLIAMRRELHGLRAQADRDVEKTYCW